MEAPKAPTGVESGEGVSPSPVRVGSGAHKKFSILSFEMLNFYVFRTPEQGDSTATVIMMLHHSLYFQRRNKLRTRQLGP